MGPDPVGLGLFQEGVTGHRGRPAWWERMRGGGQGRCTWRWRIGDAQLQARGWEVTRAKRGHGLPAPSQPQWGPARRQVTSTTAAEGERRQSCNRVPRPAGSSPARGAGFPALGSPASSALCGRSSSREDLTRSGGSRSADTPAADGHGPGPAAPRRATPLRVVLPRVSDGACGAEYSVSPPNLLLLRNWGSSWGTPRAGAQASGGRRPLPPGQPPSLRRGSPRGGFPPAPRPRAAGRPGSPARVRGDPASRTARLPSRETTWGQKGTPNTPFLFSEKIQDDIAS